MYCIWKPGSATVRSSLDPQAIQLQKWTSVSFTSSLRPFSLAYYSSMGTLLHECIHALLESYGCSSRCSDLPCQERQHYTHGTGGHGMAFVRIATYIEAVHDSSLATPVNIGLRLRDFADIRISPEDIESCHPSWHAILHKHNQSANEATCAGSDLSVA